MATEGYVKFEYFSKSTPPYYDNRSFPELVDDESIVISSPSIELSYHQYYSLFKRFLMAVGFNERDVIAGACNLAFNEMNNENTMREVAEEYDLIMNEDLPKIIEDNIREEKEKLDQNKSKTNIWEERYWSVYRKLQEIKNVKYTDEELDAMCDHAEKQEERRQMTYDEAIAAGWEMTADGFWIREDKELKMWNGLVPGSPEAVEKGCICPVMDNAEMPLGKKWVDAECSIHGRKKND